MGRRFWNSLAAMTLLASGIALHAQDRSSLPIQPAPFGGTIAENAVDSKPGASPAVRAPANAPNIFLFMSDDVGFAMAHTFGGPVPTPNFDRLAAQGQRYNRFHTTGICSPTRASLLTGRNSHVAATGYLTDMATNYPGYNTRLPDATATIAETLRMNGWSTAMFGKHHNIPPGENSPAGPFDRWPAGKWGFEYFFGIIGGDTNQWHPALYRGTNRLPDAEGKPELVDKRLADEAIIWLHNQKAAAPDKPFLLYLAPGSAHAPLHAPPEVIARFKGQFDGGWDKMREASYARQLAMGIIPPGTKLTPRPDAIPAWDSVSPKMKAFAARSMEVAAAMLAYQDEQLGRVLAEMERMGVADNTLFAVILGDNGASAEGGPKGSVNELASIVGRTEDDDEWLAANTATLGSDASYPGYQAGWAWAMNTPLRWVKQYASMLGAVRNGMILSWKGKVASPGAICARFGHVNDMAPTILEAAGLPAPRTVNGVSQKPFDGQSLVSSLRDCAPDHPRTQYFEINGKFSLYQDGWYLSGDQSRKPWEALPAEGARPTINWSLYDLRTDFSQADDISVANPGKLKAMQAEWQAVALANNVLPLDHRFGAARATIPAVVHKHFDYWGGGISIPANHEPSFILRSYMVTAKARLDSAGASGVLMAVGSKFGGWSLYLDKGRPAFTYKATANPADAVTIISPRALPKGDAQIRLKVKSLGFGNGISFSLFAADDLLAEGQARKIHFVPAGLGETIDTGRDTGFEVTPYETAHGALEGEIHHVAIDFD
jgi:arylsulfatase A-like enzyme